MMSWPLEDSTPTIVVGVILLALMSLAFVRTGFKWWLYGIGAVIVLMIGLLLLDHYVVTDRERVKLSLDAAVKALANNDKPRVMELISPAGTELRQQAETALAHLKFSSVSVGSDLEIKVNRHTSPATATARFTGRVDVAIDGMHVATPQMVVLTLREEGGQWRFFDYQLQDDETLPPFLRHRGK